MGNYAPNWDREDASIDSRPCLAEGDLSHSHRVRPGRHLGDRRIRTIRLQLNERPVAARRSDLTDRVETAVSGHEQAVHRVVGTNAVRGNGLPLQGAGRRVPDAAQLVQSRGASSRCDFQHPAHFLRAAVQRQIA